MNNSFLDKKNVNSNISSSLNNMKKISNYSLYQLGNLEGNTKIVDTVEQLRNSPPNIVVAECIRTIKFVQNKSEEQTIYKNQHYCCGLGVYAQLQYYFKNGKKVKVLKPGKFEFRKIYKPYSGQDLSNKNILVWRTGGIGDLLFIQPILRFLKIKYPSCKILFSCAPQYKSMVETYREVDIMLNLPFSTDELFKVDYHAIFEGVIERTREAEKLNAYKLFSKSLSLDIPESDLVPQLEPKQDKLKQCIKILNDWNIFGSKFILVQCRASSIIRTPRPEFWKKVIDYLTDKGHNVLLTDMPSKSSDIDNFIQILKNKEKIFNFSKFSLSLDISIALASLSELIIATDSSLIHIGAALSKKILGIYGPFPGHIRMSTYSKDRSDWVEGKDLPCISCFTHGNIPCRYARYGYSPCYDTIDINELFSKIERLLA